MNYLSTCSGIEAASVAWHRLGWTPAGFSEIEPFPSAVLAHHWPSVPNHGDFTTLIGAAPNVDLLVGGTPCQAFSIAGLRNSLSDDRGNLTLQYVRLLDSIDDVRAARGNRGAVALWENVPGVLSTKDNAFGCFLGAIAGEDEPIVPASGKWPRAGLVLGARRRVAWCVIDAQFFGVAQRRRRVFAVAVPQELIADIGERACPSAILSIGEGLRRDTPTRSKAGEGVTGTLGARTKGGGGFGTDFECAGGLQVTHSLRGEGFDASEDGTGRGTPLVAARMTALGEYVEDGTASTIKTRDYKDATDLVTTASHAIAFTQNQMGDVMHSLGTNQNATGRGAPNVMQAMAVAFAQNSRDELREMPVVGALAAQPGMKQTSYIRSDLSVRRLTPTECERLQGFPDGHTAIPWRGRSAGECPDGPRYRALGNSMAVPVMRWIGERIESCLGGKS